MNDDLNAREDTYESIYERMTWRSGINFTFEELLNYIETNDRGTAVMIGSLPLFHAKQQFW